MPVNSKKFVKADLTDPEVIRRDLRHWRSLLKGAGIAPNVRRALVELIRETKRRLAEIEGRAPAH